MGWLLLHSEPVVVGCFGVRACAVVRIARHLFPYNQRSIEQIDPPDIRTEPEVNAT
jgi:hypothetical protein